MKDFDVKNLHLRCSQVEIQLLKSQDQFYKNLWKIEAEETKKKQERESQESQIINFVLNQNA